MKKVFKFALVAFMAAAVAVSCKDDPKPTPGPGPGPEPEPEYTGPVQGTSAWSVIGTVLETNWDTDYVLAEADGIFVLKNLKLAAGNEFKIRENKAWDNNRGGDFAELGAGFDVAHNGANIKPELDGIYDVYYNPAVEQMAITAANGTPSWKELPQGQSWDYVMNITDYKTNSEFHFEADPITLDPNATTIQWKFYSTKWNDYDKVDSERGYKVWCNRLGQISNLQEKGYLFRFNDGGSKGQLRFNSDFVGIPANGYVVKDDKAYIWETNTWHVLTIVSDGTNVSIYDNAELVQSYAQNTAEIFKNGLKFQRFDISMTWDDGTGYDKGQAFLGYQAFTRIWNKALSADEVAASLCDVPANSEGLQIYWAWNLDDGATVENLAAAAGYDLDFTTALAGGQNSYVKAEDIAGTWTDVTEVEGLAPVCAAE